MKKTKILTLVAMAALLAACGGTSSSVTSSSQGGSTPSTSQTPSVSSETSTATSSQGGSSSTTSQTPVEEEYRVNIGSTMGGITVTSDKEKAKAGEVITLTVTVTNNSYTVTGVFYDESACTKTNDTTYWFIMPDHPVTVTVRANVEGDVTLQGDITAALTEENGIYVARNVRVDADSDFNLVIKSGDTTEELNSFSLDRYKTTANIEYSRQNEYAFEIKGGCTYDFFYDVNNGARPFYVRRTAVNALPSGEDSLYSLFAGSILSEYTVNPQGITAINYTNEAANETYQWKLYNNNTSYAKVTESDSTGAVKTKAEVYTKLEDSKLTIVDTYTPSTEDAYEYDYSCRGDSEKYAGRYVVSDNDEDGDLTSDIEFEQYSNYVNSHTADFVLKQGYNHGMESIETDFMHSYRVGMTVEDYIKQASVNITSEDTAEGFTTKIVSSKTYDDTGTNGGVGKYHLEYRATLNFKDDGTLLSVDYEYKTFDESVFNFTNFTWLSGDTASNYANNGKLVNHVTATYTYGTESAPDYTFDVTPYFVSQIKDLSINNPDADIDAANKLNVGDAAEDYATCTYLPETALDTWQYEFLSSSNENVIAYDDSYVEYAAKMTIALTYLKCDDDWIDDQKMSKQVYKKILNHSYQSIKKEFPQKIEMIEKQLDKIHEYEKMEDVRIDDISGCFGKVMAEICCFQDDLWQDYLREFGFFLGKYIYLLDAYDDIEKDLKDNNYNPFISHFHDEHFEERCHDLLEMMISRAAEAFEYLPIEENVEILRNIIYSGVWSQYELRYQKRMEDKK